MPSYTIEVGDTVHARIYNEDKSSVAIQEFIVTEIEGTVYRGGALDCDLASGWELELLRKSPELLALPETISEITAYDHSRRAIYLTGKGESWRTESGEEFPVSQILSWENGHI
jgi:nitrogen fixation protein